MIRRDFKEAVAHRRSYYKLLPQSPVSDGEIEAIIKFAMRKVPAAFNKPSVRVVLLLGEDHKALWDIVKDVLRQQLPIEVFTATEQKIDSSFQSGYGTILFFEDQTVVQGLQERFPIYSENFPVWSQQGMGMSQMTIWTMLEDIGFGASLQHYNPLIDMEVIEKWSIAKEWKLVAQMPFGLPAADPDPKEEVFEENSFRVMNS